MRILSFLLFFSWASHVSATTVSVEPSSTAVAPLTTFSLSVNVSGVHDLYAFQFDVDFTPGLLFAISVSEGSFLSNGGPTIFIPGAINDQTGAITFTAGTLVGAVPGVAGDGTMATLNFEALHSGISPIRLSNVILLNSALSPITTTLANGAVTVRSSMTPEPTSRMLIIVPAGLLGIFRRRLIRDVEADGLKVLSRQNEGL